MTIAQPVGGWRYLRVRKIFVEGEIIPVTMEELKTETRQSRANVDQSHGARSASIRHSIRGIEHTLRRKLCHSGGTYGLKKGGRTELMVLDATSGMPLIRAVYLTEIPRRKWWRCL